MMGSVLTIHGLHRNPAISNAGGQVVQLGAESPDSVREVVHRPSQRRHIIGRFLSAAERPTGARHGLVDAVQSHDMRDGAAGRNLNGGDFLKRDALNRCHGRTVSADAS